MGKKLIYKIVGYYFRIINNLEYRFQRNKNTLIVFDTSLETDNLGDFIIMKYCNRVIDDLFHDYKKVNISTHSIPNENDEDKISKSKMRVVCGTNLLTSHIEQWWNWRLPDGLINKLKYKNVILLGVGWGEYQDECSDYSKMIYNSILNPKLLHSVRDEYTERKLKLAGIKNVINTGCPTMWNLTQEFCKDIPISKALNVITTITDYRKDIYFDNLMLQILSRNYQYIYLWLQGKSDEEYLKTLKIPKNLKIIPNNLSSYEQMLSNKDVDYVGTRLHAGIHALNYKIRTIVIAVDNRAVEISRDTNLPIVNRHEIEEKLEIMINSDFNCEINIKQKNIENFKRQFL